MPSKDEFPKDVGRRNFLRTTRNAIVAAGAAALGVGGEVLAQDAGKAFDVSEFIAKDAGTIEERTSLVKEVVARVKALHESGNYAPFDKDQMDDKIHKKLWVEVWENNGAITGKARIQLGKRYAEINFDEDIGGTINGFHVGIVEEDDPITGIEGIDIWADSKQLGKVYEAHAMGARTATILFDGKSATLDVGYERQNPTQLELANRIYRGILELVLAAN